MSALEGTSSEARKRVLSSPPPQESAGKRARGRKTQVSEDILWRIAQSPRLSLQELALKAATCRVFHKAYTKACAAESAWLDELAAAFKSVFEPHVVDGFCKWLLCPLPRFSRRPQQDSLPVARNFGELEDGENFSQIEKLCYRDGGIRSRAVPGAVLGDRPGCHGILEVGWLGISFCKQGNKSLVCTDIMDEFLLRLKDHQRHWQCRSEGIFFTMERSVEKDMVFCMDWCPKSLALPCLGFLHHVLVQEALLPSHRAGKRKGMQRKLTLELPEGLHRCKGAAEKGGEVQRALLALRMRHSPHWTFCVQCTRRLLEN